MEQNFKNKNNFHSWQTKALTEFEFWDLSAEERLKYLSLLATLAANSHNTQPWFFSFDKRDESLTVYLDTEKVLPISDIKGRQAVLSVGCAMANFETAALALACSLKKDILMPEKQIITSQEKPIAVVKYKIEQSKVSPSEEIIKNYKAILSRRVDRGEYDHDRKLDSSLLQQIENLGQDYGVKTILISDWARKVALAELQLQADAFVINNKQFAEELIKDWMIENNSDSYYGMPGNTFRLNDQQTAKIKNRFSQSLGFESDDAVAISQLGKKGILSCQCVGLLTVEKDSSHDWLNAGYVLELGALIFESQGVSWAVHAGLAEVSQVNMLMLRPIAMTTKRPVVLFRAGYLKSNETRSLHSPRVPIEKLWRNENV
jgi:hypothetical protein